MQIPNSAEVKQYQDAEIRSLLVGRFRKDDPNFVAVRTEYQVGTGDPTPYMAILSSWVDGQPSPFLCNPQNPPMVLDLGANWSIDVSVDESMPGWPATFAREPNEILFRAGPGFFIDLGRNQYLDIASGSVVDVLPNRGNIACWSQFTLHLAQPDIRGPGAEVFCWPRGVPLTEGPDSPPD